MTVLQRIGFYCVDGRALNACDALEVLACFKAVKDAACLSLILRTTASNNLLCVSLHGVSLTRASGSIDEDRAVLPVQKCVAKIFALTLVKNIRLSRALV